MKFASGVRVVWLGALLAPMLAGQTPGRPSRSAPAESSPTSALVSLDLSTLDASAGVVFSGTVLGIERVMGSDGSPMAVRVSFYVDEAVRGCHTGDTYVLQEWPGLWVRGDRYRKGQKVILFLHSLSATGLSSPVAGDVGVFKVDSAGLLRLTPLQSQALAHPPRATNPQPAVAPSPNHPDPKEAAPRLRRFFDDDEFAERYGVDGGE